MNTGCFWGNLTRDPEELKHYGDRVSTRFTVAVRRDQKDENGRNLADFIPVTVWGRSAENCARFLRKGSPVAVVYHLRSGSYTDDSGKRHYTLDAVADRVDFLPAARPGENQGTAQTPPDGTGQPAPGTGSGEMAPVEGDDLPF